MCHHIFGDRLDGIGNDAQGLTTVQGVAALHTDVIAAFAEVDDTRHIVVNLTLRHLHGSTVYAVQIGIFLHSIALEAERDLRLDA